MNETLNITPIKGTVYQYTIESPSERLTHDLYDFLVFDLNRHKEDDPRPSLYLNEAEGIWHLDITSKHLSRILVTYSHH